MSNQPMPAPDYSTAFVKVPRSVLRELLPYQLELRVYLELLDRAAYQAGPRLVKGHGLVHLEVGEAVYGRGELATKLAVGERQIRTAITRLSALGFLTTKPTNLGTIATLCGYGEIGESTEAKRPAERPASDQQTSSDRPADRPLTEKREGETKKRGDKRDPSAAQLLAEAAIDEINQLASTAYKADSKATLQDCGVLAKEGVTPEQAIAVIQSKAEWLGDDKMRDYFRPGTLLRPTKFRRYLADLDAGAPKKTSRFQRIPMAGSDRPRFMFDVGTDGVDHADPQPPLHPLAQFIRLAEGEVQIHEDGSTTYVPDSTPASEEG